jgi:hypothetical protein
MAGIGAMTAESFYMMNTVDAEIVGMNCYPQQASQNLEELSLYENC